MICVVYSVSKYTGVSQPPPLRQAVFWHFSTNGWKF